MRMNINIDIWYEETSIWCETAANAFHQLESLWLWQTYANWISLVYAHLRLEMSSSDRKFLAKIDALDRKPNMLYKQMAIAARLLIWNWSCWSIFLKLFLFCYFLVLVAFPFIRLLFALFSTFSPLYFCFVSPSSLPSHICIFDSYCLVFFCFLYLPIAPPPLSSPHIYWKW